MLYEGLRLLEVWVNRHLNLQHDWWTADEHFWGAEPAVLSQTAADWQTQYPGNANPVQAKQWPEWAKVFQRDWRNKRDWRTAQRSHWKEAWTEELARSFGRQSFNRHNCFIYWQSTTFSSSAGDSGCWATSSTIRSDAVSILSPVYNHRRHNQSWQCSLYCVSYFHSFLLYSWLLCHPVLHGWMQRRCSQVSKMSELHKNMQKALSGGIYESRELNWKSCWNCFSRCHPERFRGTVPMELPFLKRYDGDISRFALCGD